MLLKLCCLVELKPTALPSLPISTYACRYAPGALVRDTCVALPDKWPKFRWVREDDLSAIKGHCL